MGATSPPKRNRETERDLSTLSSINAAFELYPHPRTGATRRVTELDAARRRRFAAIAAEHPGEGLDQVVADAISGAVVRNGLGVQASGWDPWPHFELDVLISPAKLSANLEACHQARALGWSEPFAMGADSRRPPRRSTPQEATRNVLREAPALTREQARDQVLAALDALPEGAFKEERRRIVLARYREESPVEEIAEL